MAGRANQNSGYLDYIDQMTVF